MKRRIVITGMGAITPLGLNYRQMWESLIRGESGVGHITLFDASASPVRIAGEVKNFYIEQLPVNKEITQYLNRRAAFGFAAALEAIEEASLAIEELNPDRMGLSIGADFQNPDIEHMKQLYTFLSSGNGTGNPITPIITEFLKSLPYQVSLLLATTLGISGPVNTVSTACSSGAHTVADGLNRIRRGEADVIIAGGCDSLINPLMIAMFDLLGTLSHSNDDPSRSMRPFDLDRNGFVMSEGAGIVVLEELEHAKHRGANIYAELIGCGCSSNAYRLTDSPPDGYGAYLAMKMAIEDAGLSIDEIDYINAHGTSTPMNDVTETIAIKRCFGKRAYRIPVSSTKSMTGHGVCASGAVELIVTILTIKNGLITPTINYTTPDPECDLDYVPNQAREADIRVAISNSFGFGGQNVCIIARRYEE